MKITKGYNDKPTKIRISAVSYDRTAEVWIEQEGIVKGFGQESHSETLAYASLIELLDLRDECNRAIQELVK